MPPSDNLGEIVNSVRSELGYKVYDDGSVKSVTLGGVYWLFRNIMKKPIIPAFHERYIMVLAAVGTKTGDNFNVELLGENEYSLIQILPHAVESFPKVFRAGMQAYLEQRQYVTKPQQAMDYAINQMCESLNSQG